MSSKHVIILAGGKGTRLRPYTIVLPKPLVPIGEEPILEIIIKQLANNNFKKLTLAVNHQANIIKAFFGDGNKWGVEINYSQEDSPLGTMGPLTCIEDLPENFMVMNGDILTDLNFSDFFEQHLNKKAIFSISATKRNLHSEYGVLHTSEDNKLINFQEKPVYPCNVSMGIYAINKRVLNFIPMGVPFGFDHLMLELIKKKESVNVINHDGYWLDIGREDDYRKAIEEFEYIKRYYL